MFKFSCRITHKQINRHTRTQFFGRGSHSMISGEFGHTWGGTRYSIQSIAIELDQFAIEARSH